MTWKNLVTFADGSEEGLVLTRSALKLAQKTAAHVEAIV